MRQAVEIYLDLDLTPAQVVVRLRRLERVEQVHAYCLGLTELLRREIARRHAAKP